MLPDLGAKSHCAGMHARSCGQEPVVIAASVSEPSPVIVKRQTRHHDKALFRALLLEDEFFLRIFLGFRNPEPANSQFIRFIELKAHLLFREDSGNIDSFSVADCSVQELMCIHLAPDAVVT